MNHYPDYSQGHLDPQAEALLTQLARSSAPPLATLSPEKARVNFFLPSWLGKARGMAVIRDLSIPGPGGAVRLRTYLPHDRSPLPVLVFFHGGGFVVGTIDEFNAFCTFLASGAGCLVFSVDYRLAPEQKHPAAVEDAFAALAWVASHATELGGDPARIAVAGDSAGGNLAAVAAMMARDQGGPALALQVLICPWVDLSCTETDSFRLFGQGIWLSTASVQWFRRHYLVSQEQALLPQASPFLAKDLGHLPPALIVNAEFDVLRDQVQAYGRRLEASGNAIQYRFYPGMLHDFATLPGLFDRAREAIDDICACLRQAFGSNP